LNPADWDQHGQHSKTLSQKKNKKINFALSSFYPKDFFFSSTGAWT
jgi:hypothetical protein